MLNYQVVFVIVSCFQILVIKTLDPDWVNFWSSQTLDPDQLKVPGPDQMNTNPKHFVQFEILDRTFFFFS
jgi:hypothetical protein